MTRDPLVQLAAAGDEDARARLVSLCTVPLRRFLERRMGRRLARECSAADLVQEVFGRVFQAIDRMPGDADQATFRRWLFRHAEWVLASRGAAARSFTGESAAGTAGVEMVAGADPASTGSVTRADQVAWVHELLDRLPRDYGEVVRLRLAGKSFAEIGDQLGVEEAAARQRFSRILRALRDRPGS